ncbi:MAG: D-alanine--D-alanine ligase [Spirochaetaceae bacterium]|nr:MAG: D-alanine--D-alanine ligase [Spirochaetaceae bacterium]
MSLRCALLYGGKSGEHEVSLQSAASVFRNIDRSRFEPILIGIAKTGCWYLQPRSIYEAGLGPDTALEIIEDPSQTVDCRPGVGLFCSGEHLQLDVVFPVLHGSLGEDGTVQGLLEVVELPYVGAGVLGSSVGMDKDLVKQLWRAHGIPTLDSLTASAVELASDSMRQAFITQCIETFGPELFVKPARTGSSVGITKTHSPDEIEPAVQNALTYDTKVLIEPARPVREIEISVIGNGEPYAFPPGEVIPSHEFYDYDAKYLDPDGAQLIVPAHLDATVMEKARSIAEAAYSAAACEGMARVDLFLLQDTHELVVNEINTIPGFTRISMFPRMCSAAGLPYSELITRLIELAQERETIRASLRYER